MERAARISGARFGFLVGDTALLAFALYRFALDRLVAEGFTPVLPPGAGARGGDVRDRLLPVRQERLLLRSRGRALSRRHLGGSVHRAAHGRDPRGDCRSATARSRPASAARPVRPGKDTRGMFRVHQFQKVEMVVYTRPNESWDEHERMLAIEEALVQAARPAVPRREHAPRATSSRAAAKRYDIEAWFPSQERYREITSCSNTTDYQARRSGIRYRAGERARDAAHAERHGGDRPLGARDPGELPAATCRRCCSGVRRAGPGREVRLVWAGATASHDA